MIVTNVYLPVIDLNLGAIKLIPIIQLGVAQRNSLFSDLIEPTRVADTTTWNASPMLLIRYGPVEA